MKALVACLALAASLQTAPVLAAEPADALLLQGTWVGKWKSDRPHQDNAQVVAVIAVDTETRTAVVMMAQATEWPAPSYDSVSIGKIEDAAGSKKILIDPASSGIPGGGTELIFWLDGPMILRGTYKNEFDSGRFEFRRFSNKGA